MLAQIVLARVTADEDDETVRVERARDLQSGREVRAGRAAAEDAFDAPKLTRHLERFAVGDVDDLVNVLELRVLRDDLLPDAFDKVGRDLVRLARLLVGLEDRAVWVCADDAYVRVLLFQKPARAGDRAARADAGDEVRDPPFGLFPDFGAGRAVVRFGVSGVRVLIRIERIGCLAGDALRGRDVVIGRARLGGC